MKICSFGILSLGHWDLFAICFLVLGILAIFKDNVFFSYLIIIAQFTAI
jgi:hypothetical protein